MKVLFCCMGNICRSPTAEGVFRHLVEAAGLAHRIRIDSAGTHGYHAGHPPDGRTLSAAASRGYDLGKLRARQVSTQDFAEFDYVLAMDLDNLAELNRLCPPAYRNRIRLFMDYAVRQQGREVPDPYYGAEDGFALVLDLIEDGSAGLLEDIKKKLG